LARAADLYLASACASGDPAAISLLDATLPSVIRPALARIPLVDLDEIVQRVRVALLLHDEAGTCGLARYTGRGELRGYLRAVALRIAFKQLERETAPPLNNQDEFVALLPDTNDSPDLALVKERCRSDLRASFAHALVALTPRERTLLRQHYIDGLTIDALSRLYQVHRSTCLAGSKSCGPRFFVQSAPTCTASSGTTPQTSRARSRRCAVSSISACLIS
jgi:RNA polymerase sigma-70 factor (ECF subfamily)